MNRSMQTDTKRPTDSPDDTTAALERRTQQGATNSSSRYGTELTHGCRYDRESSVMRLRYCNCSYSEIILHFTRCN